MTPLWTRESLRRLVETRLRGYRLICVSNREPYIHERRGDAIEVLSPASGVVSALDPVLQATGGIWVAHGSGTADRECSDAAGRVAVPPGKPAYTLHRVWLSEEEERGYYAGFSNDALWPLCHLAWQRPIFEREDWEHYRTVNERFADAVVEEAGAERALVFVNDYHYALLPALLKRKLPSAIVFQFWHIPWPNPEAFRVLPWKVEVLEGLLGNDLLSFHIQHHCNNFLEAVDRELESRIDRERFSVVFRGSRTLVRPHPIGVDFEGLSAEASRPEIEASAAAFRARHGLEKVRILLGVDRLDYSKGILERLRAFDRLLTRRPEHRGQLTLVQIGVPTRSTVPAYRAFEASVDALVEELNRRHGTSGWSPVIFLKRNFDKASLVSFYRAADVVTVTSLHDGMNLVAKEFVACRPDLDGVLLLSRFTGAARELGQAVLVNPFAVDDLADRIHEALSLPADERRVRMERMRATVAEQNVFKWIGKILLQAVKIDLE